MTMLVDNFRIPAGKDKRKKLSDVEKGLIKEDYLSGVSIVTGKQIGRAHV